MPANQNRAGGSISLPTLARAKAWIARTTPFTYTPRMQLTRSATLILGLAVLAGAPARADIYKYVDGQGNITFTDRFRPGAVKVMSDFAPSRGHAEGRKSVVAKAPSPAYFPKVAPATQKVRDDMRRDILAQERAEESRQLDSVRAQIAGAKPGDDVVKLRESARRHEDNIAMLDKELARFK
jgi:hypothetical protein